MEPPAACPLFQPRAIFSRPALAQLSSRLAPGSPDAPIARVSPATGGMPNRSPTPRRKRGARRKFLSQALRTD
jgi:hypothetical protein